MEIGLRYIPFDATRWDVQRAIGAVLHSDEFNDAVGPNARPLNFEVKLDKLNEWSIGNKGTGTLALSDSRVAHRLLRMTRSGGPLKIVVGGKKIRLQGTDKKPARNTTERLEKTPYLDPAIEEQLESKLEKLNVGLHVDKLQFGVYFRRLGDPITRSRVFSNEYEISHTDKGAGMLEFEYTVKLIRIRLGNPMTEELASNVVINFHNIRKMATGIDYGNPFICFELLVPAVFQRERFNRTLTGHEWSDTRKFRQRLDSINDGHAAVAPYAHQIRIILHDQRDLDKFSELCIVADLGRPIRTEMEGFRAGFFSQTKIYHVLRVLKEFEWPVAFQIEALLRCGLLTTEDLLERFIGPIRELCRRHPDSVRDTLRFFTEALRARDARTSQWECFQHICSQPPPERQTLTSGNFLCHHVTIAPSRMLLEGPYVIQSNRVIRQYEGFEDYFLRVDFRDEDRLQYRWDKDTDGTSLLRDRVGSKLKNGFELAGRYFQFLAYSSSALREHAVWFVSPFKHPEKGYVTAESIRNSLGDFSGVINCPSKYAARIAQAFTATDPSVDISRDQFEEVEDLGEEPYLFTDGVGTISKELGDMIWEALCKERDDGYRQNVQPSAYQIRFLGYKGVVAVDHQLKGVKMRLRKSMNKFEGPAEDTATIEIARAFERPNTCYLNRPLIMVLEDRGVDKQAFLDLQERAVARIHMASDTIENCRRLFREHHLGTSYRLPYLWQFLRSIGMGMRVEHDPPPQVVLNDPFLERLIQFAKNDVLRSIKHNARIPIEDSYLLVGIADEGPAYELEGLPDVVSLKEGEVYVCVQGPDHEEPEYIQGPVTVSRSPVVHPGDVQRVHAIGKPPATGLCFFRELKNVVVFPSTGSRSMCSGLGGGDLDGDLYAVIKDETILPPDHHLPAEYKPVGQRKLDRPSTIEDVCDFVIEYIDSDILGLLSDRHLIIADQSREGTKDSRCMELAALCSQAVDYPKNGIPVDIESLPKKYMPFKPDWKKSEDNNPRVTDYYESDRALGWLYRNVELLKTPETVQPPKNGRPTPLSDCISQALIPYIEQALGPDNVRRSDAEVSQMKVVFQRYADELRYICVTHSLSDSHESRLVEEEVVVGTITATCSQHRYRNDRTYRMRLHALVLTSNVRKKLYVRAREPNMATEGDMRYGLTQAWLAWDYGMRNRGHFGANSFALTALVAVADALADLGLITLKMENRKEDEEGNGA